MKANVGVWIDHRKAVIVTVTDQGVESRMVVSKAERQPRRGGDRPLEGKYDLQQVPADDRSQRAYRGELRVYYDTVVTALGDAAKILLFGPGEAKSELKKRLVQAKLGGRVVGLETVDKMTDRQVESKVRKHFAK